MEKLDTSLFQQKERGKTPIYFTAVMYEIRVGNDSK